MVEVKEEQSKDDVDAKLPNQHHNSSPVVKHDASMSINTLNLFDDKQLAAAENFLTKIMRSDKGGIKNVNDGLAILMRARDLNIPFSSCIEHIHVINGKTGVDIHIIKALLLKAGCTWKCIKDYQPLYEYTDGINVYVDNSFPEYAVRCSNQKEAAERAAKDETKDNIYIYPVKWYQDFNGNLYKDYQLNTAHFSIVINKAQAAAVIKENKIPVYRVPNKPVDYITEYKIKRIINNEPMIGVGKFTFSEANTAGFFEKDTYKKYPRILIGHRAFTYAARDVASDVLFGVCESSELKIITNTELNDADIIDINAVEI